MAKFLYPETSTHPLSFSLPEEEVTIYPGKTVELPENDAYVKRLIALEVITPIDKGQPKADPETEITDSSQEEQP